MPQRSSLLHLERQQCFPLYAASRLVIQMYTPFLSTLDITYPQYLVLLVLWQHGGQTVSEIGNHLLLESNTLTPLLKRLEQKKIIERKRMKLDERVVKVVLTNKGKAMKKEARQIPLKLSKMLSDSSISSMEMKHFQTTLRQLILFLRQKNNSNIM